MKEQSEARNENPPNESYETDSLSTELNQTGSERFKRSTNARLWGNSASAHYLEGESRRNSDSGTAHYMDSGGSGGNSELF